jgi:hypothetical protein
LLSHSDSEQKFHPSVCCDYCQEKREWVPIINYAPDQIGDIQLIMGHFRVGKRNLIVVGAREPIPVSDPFNDQEEQTQLIEKRDPDFSCLSISLADEVELHVSGQWEQQMDK